MRRGGNPTADRADAARLLEEAYRGPAWHGPSLTTALRGVTASEAAWRPAPGRNTIWELVLHAAYAKHVVLGRLTQRRGSFGRALRRPWWPAPSEPADERSWRRDRALLTATHAALVAAVRRASSAELRRRVRRPMVDHIGGVALHDTYHGGQISLLRKLFRARRRG
jgi:hypothetical protein